MRHYLLAASASAVAAAPVARAGAGDTAAPAGHVRIAPLGCPDIAGQPRAALDDAPVDCIRDRSSAARDRTRHTPALRPGSTRRSTPVPAMAGLSLRLQASAHSLGARARAAQRSALPLDLIPERCNTVPALVANTVGRGGRNNFPVIAVVAPVLDDSVQFYCNRACMAKPGVAGMGWGMGRSPM